MTAFQLQTFIPSDGNFSITLPEHLRGTDVELFISKKEMIQPTPLSKEEYLALLNSYRGTLRSVDYSDLRDETEREL
jgi:hypothetical protein